MHIAFVNLLIEYYSPVSGGALSTCIMQQTRRLMERGHRVSVLTRVNADPVHGVGEVVPVARPERHQLSAFSRIASKLQAKLHRWDWPYYDHYLDSLTRALRAARPDAVVCFNDLRTPRYVRDVLPDVRLAVRVSNEVPTRQPSLERLTGAVDCYLPVSQYIGDWLQATHDVAAEKIRVLPNGCDLRTFHPRDDFPSPATPLRVLFLGRLTDDKGPDLAAQAVAELRQEGHKVELTVAGARWWYGEAEDGYTRSLHPLMERAGATMLGHVTRDRVPQLVREHDVMLIPSRWNDPMPQVCFEAMASGCALVTTRRGGIPEACGDAALYADPEMPGSVAEALRQLVEDPAALMDWKQRALQRARQMTWDHNVDRLEAALRLRPPNENPESAFAASSQPMAEQPATPIAIS